MPPRKHRRGNHVHRSDESAGKISRQCSVGSFTGSVVGGNPHGDGVLVDDRGDVTRGRWQHGMLNGCVLCRLFKAKMITYNRFATKEYCTTGDRYEGDFQDGVRSGLVRSVA